MDGLVELVNACTNSVSSERATAYKKLTEKLTSNAGTYWDQKQISRNLNNFIKNLKTDLLQENSNICYDAVGLLGCLFANSSFLSILSNKDKKVLLDTLIKSANNTEEKKVLTRSLWSLAESDLDKTIYIEFFDQILHIVLKAVDRDQTSSVVALEGLKAFNFLISKIPDKVIIKANQWFEHIFFHLFHEAKKVREISFNSISVFYDNKNFLEGHSDLPNILKTVIPDLKSKYCKEMCKLIDKECCDILQEWQLIVSMIGKELHHSIPLINSLLEVVERGFKNQKNEIRIEAFKGWSSLIDNFSSDENILNHPKRIKLLSQPLKANNAKTEEVAYSKIITWWHLIVKLGDRVNEHFESIVLPYLKFCFPFGLSNSTVTDRALIMSGASSPGKRFPKLHGLCIETFCLLLDEKPTTPTSKMTPLTSNVLSSNFVLTKHCVSIFACFVEAVKGSDIRKNENKSVVCALFHGILKHVKVCLDSNQRGNSDIVKELLMSIVNLEDSCTSGSHRNALVFQFYEMLLFGDTALPISVLNCNQYHIAVGSNARDIMDGTLCTYFMHQLCGPSMLCFAPRHESYFDMWATILSSSNPAIGKLSFMKNAVCELDRTVSYLCPDHHVILMKLWEAIADELYLFINENQIIDQGDGMEHDWSCLYSVLLFPLSYLFDELATCSIQVHQKMLKVWGELWKKFAELTPLATTAEPNSEIEHVTRILYGSVVEKVNSSIDALANSVNTLSDVMLIMLETVRFSELGKSTKRSILSPAKPVKKPGPFHNLDSYISLFCFLFTKVLTMVSSQRHYCASNLFEIGRILFTKIHSPKMIWPLISLVSYPLEESIRVNPSARFGGETEKKFFTMWNKFCQIVEVYIAPDILLDQLNALSPLLTIALLSSNRNVKSRTVQLWRSSFCSTQLKIPPSLFKALQDCKLPPANIVDIDSQESMYSTSPKENIPSNISGSFLNRNSGSGKKTWQNNKSPLSTKSPKSKRKLNVEDMEVNDFVKIIPSSKSSKRILTEHQIEKLMERKTDIPALYSDLSQSASQAAYLCDSAKSNNTYSVSQGSTCLSFNKSSQNFPDTNNCEATFFDRIKTRLNKSFDSAVSEKNVKLYNNANTSQNSGGPFPSENKDNEVLDELQYSGKDLDEELKKTTLELERSLSDSVLHIKSNVNNIDGHKRKSLTPCKRSLADIKRSLKGSKPSKRDSVLLNRGDSRKKVSIEGDVSLNEIPSSQEETPRRLSKKLLDNLSSSTPKRKNSKSEEKVTATKETKEKKMPKDDLPVTPSKVTRSGRKIIAPSKDIPIPMTSPKADSKRSSSIRNANVVSSLSKTKKIKSSLEADETDSDSNSSCSDSDKNITSWRTKKIKHKERTQLSNAVKHDQELLEVNENLPLSEAKLEFEKESSSPIRNQKSLADKGSNSKTESTAVCSVKTRKSLARSSAATVTTSKGDLKKQSNIKESSITENSVKLNAADFDISDSFEKVENELSEKSIFDKADSNSSNINTDSKCTNSLEDESINANDEKNKIDNDSLSQEHEILLCNKDVEPSPTKITCNKFSNATEPDDEAITCIGEFKSIKASSRKELVRVIKVFTSPENKTSPEKGKIKELSSENVSNMHLTPTLVKPSNDEHLLPLKQVQNVDVNKNDLESPKKILFNASCSPEKFANLSDSTVSNIKFMKILPKVSLPKDVCASLLMKGTSPQKTKGLSPIKILYTSKASPTVTPQTSPYKLGKSLIKKSIEDKNGTCEHNSGVSLLDFDKEVNESPEKFSSKLSSTLGTPERKKLGKKAIESRAAMMVACAKRIIKSKASFSVEDAAENGDPETAEELTRKLFMSSSPLTAINNLEDSASKTWIKFQPSPGASPSTSILKKRAFEEAGEETPSPPVKQRRVSFADPPVSDSVTIPITPKPGKIVRAQKRLDMTKAIVESDLLSQESSKDESINCSQPLCPALLENLGSVEGIVGKLTSSSLCCALYAVLKDRGLLTIGSLAQLSEADVLSLPVKEPKISNMREVLAEYLSSNISEMKKDFSVNTEIKYTEAKNVSIDDEETDEVVNPAKNEEAISPPKVNGDINRSDGEQENNLPLKEDLVIQLKNSPDFLNKLVLAFNDNEKKDLLRILLTKLNYSSVIDLFYDFLKNQSLS